MQSRRPRPYAVGRVLATGVAAALAPVACGTTTAPQPGETSLADGPVRPVTSQPVEADGGLRCPESIDTAASLLWKAGADVLGDNRSHIGDDSRRRG